MIGQLSDRDIYDFIGLGAFKILKKNWKYCELRKTLDGFGG